MTGAPLLEAFEAGALDPRAFTHRAHVEIAAAMLAHTNFLDAAQRYQRGIEKLAAGAPQKANLTITLAFLSLISERLKERPELDSHPELFDSKLLGRWYSKDRLGLAAARTSFLMPDRTPPA